MPSPFKSTHRTNLPLPCGEATRMAFSISITHFSEPAEEGTHSSKLSQGVYQQGLESGSKVWRDDARRVEAESARAHLRWGPSACSVMATNKTPPTLSYPYQSRRSSATYRPPGSAGRQAVGSLPLSSILARRRPPRQLRHRPLRRRLWLWRLRRRNRPRVARSRRIVARRAI